MKQLSHGMFPRFFGAPFGDFGYGARFPGHPDFFPPGHMGFLAPPPHHGLLPSMEQPLPMSGNIGSLNDQFSMTDTKPVISSMSDMAYNMTKAMTEGSFMQGMDMPRLQQQQDMAGQEFGNNCDNGGEVSDQQQMIW